MSKCDLEREAFWRLAVSEQRASGLSVRAFCRREGLSDASLYAWRRRLAEREVTEPGDQLGDGPLRCDGSLAPGDFVEVALNDELREAEVKPVVPTAQGSPIEVLLPAGPVVRVSRGFDAATLRRGVEALS
jgi:transposase-like protein